MVNIGLMMVNVLMVNLNVTIDIAYIRIRHGEKKQF